MIEWGPDHFDVELRINPKGVRYGETLIVDVETDERGNFVGIGVMDNPLSVDYYSVLTSTLGDILSCRRLVGHNIKFDARQLKSWGIDIKPEQLAQDTMLKSYVRNSTKESHGLKELAKEHLMMEWPSYKDMVGRGKAKQTLDKQEIEKVAAYCGDDCIATWRLNEFFDKIMTPSQKSFYSLIELPTMQLLFKMELLGVTVDTEYLKELKVSFGAELAESCQNIQQLLSSSGYELKCKKSCPKKEHKHEFNPASPIQVKDILHHFGYNVQSTDKQALEVYRKDEFVSILLDMRKVAKVLSTYVDNWLGLQTLPKMHTTFNQIALDQATDAWKGIKTGRLCIHPETLIECPRDLSKFPSGVALKDMKVNDYVYSLDWEKRLCLKKVRWVGPTAKKETIKVYVKSRWGKITEFSCSKDHLVRMFNGEWKSAGSLKVGNHLCGFVRRGIDEYASLFPSSLRRKRGESGGKAKEHRWVYAQVNGFKSLTSYQDVRHTDGNKLNNTPSNLRLLSTKEHRGIHLPPKTDSELKAMLEKNGYKGLTKHFKREVRKRGFVATNHTVIGIEPLGVQQLWDMEVEDTYTLFGGEVALHNSSSEPNLHNIPKPGDDEDEETIGKALRRAFIASPGHSLIVADYSQIQFRLLAHYSKEKILLDAFKNGEDVHEAAAKALGVNRSIAKTYNFAVLFGAFPEKIAATIKCSVDDAKRYLAQYWRVLPGVRMWMERVKMLAKVHRSVKTIFGRVIPINDIDSRDWGLRNHAERTAINYIIQGGEADIMKKAMLECHKAGYTPILQVHDELLWDAPNGNVDKAESEVKSILESIVTLDVPLTVSIGHGRSWYEAKN